MAEFALEVTENGGNDLAAGVLVDSVYAWSPAFDHAALVAAKRSRPDGKDLHMRHTTAGRVGVVSVLDPNTADCRIAFNLASAIGGFASDADYRVVFGNLGRAVPVYVAAGVAGADFTLAASAPPAVALPITYGFALEEVVDYGVRGSDGPLVARRATLHETPTTRLRARWPSCRGEDAYEIRALLASVKGAGTISVGRAVPYRYVPGSLAWRQESADHFFVEIEVESADL